MEYIIYADESAAKGPRYSNFYGGALVRGADVNRVRTELRHLKTELRLSEAKWGKVSTAYLGKYKQMVDQIFQLVGNDTMKLRVMFTDNRIEPQNLTAEHRRDQYFILYYHFLKHAFGLQYANEGGQPIRVRFYLDHMPGNNESKHRFRSFLSNLSLDPEFRKANIHIAYEDIVEVDSAQHEILQCVDIVLGALQFRLNRLHLNKPEGSRIRGSKTIAKEKLYRYINTKIRALYPHFNFNIGVSTGTHNDIANRFFYPYRHWRFVPKDRATRPLTTDEHKKAPPHLLRTNRTQA